MGFLVPKLQLNAGEQMLWSQLANHQQTRNGRLHQMGGRLTVTDQRAVFTPNRLDRHRGAELWQVKLTELTSTSVMPPSRLPGPWAMAGSTAEAETRDRLCLAANGDEQLFTLNGSVEGAVRRLRDAVATVPGAPATALDPPIAHSVNLAERRAWFRRRVTFTVCFLILEMIVFHWLLRQPWGLLLLINGCFGALAVKLYRDQSRS